MRYFLPLLLIASTLSAAPPSRVASYGPNGTHWPNLITTPFLYDAQTNDIEVACSWSAISTAINALTPTQVSDGARILVQPGTLVGNGASSSATSVMFDTGSQSWTSRVTVAPRDGYGTVTINGGFKFTRVYNVCFAGFYCTGGFYFVDSTKSALAWTRVNSYSAILSSVDAVAVDQFELAEVVWPNAQTSNADVLQLISYDGDITNFKLHGLWMAPHYYVIDTLPRPHTDTIQIYRAGTGTYDNIDITIMDSFIAGSNNAAIQTGGTDGITFTHNLILGNTAGVDVYPITSGGEPGESKYPINGAGQNWTSTDSYFYGSMALSNPGSAYSDQPFLSVATSTISFSPSGFTVPQSGSWTVDTAKSSYIALVPSLSTDASLAALWADSSGSVVDTPVISPTGGEVDATQSVTLTCATADSTIYYTTDGNDPTTGSTVYSAPFNVSANTVVKAFAVASGLTDSAIASATFTFKAVTPIIVPIDTQLINVTSVNITTTTSGASIYYRTDGLTPTTADTLYSGPFQLTESATISAIAVKAGLADSEVSTSQITIGQFTTVGTGFTNITFPARAGTFYAEWDATPHAANMDGVFGFASDSVDWFSDISVSARFWTDGTIQARNGGSYGAAATVNYSAETSYHFRAIINLAAETYDLYVTPSGGAETQIASTYAFRSDAPTITDVDFMALAATTDSFTVENVILYSSVSGSSGTIATPALTVFSAPITTPTPTPTPSPSVAITLTTYSGSGPASSGVHTLSGKSIGDADSTRQVFIKISMRDGGTISSVTIQGISATTAVTASSGSSPNFTCNWYYASVPTGTTADISFTTSGAPNWYDVGVYSVTNASTTLLDTGTAITGNTLSDTLTTETNGGVLAGIAVSEDADSNPGSWDSPLTKDYARDPYSASADNAGAAHCITTTSSTIVETQYYAGPTFNVMSCFSLSPL